MKPSAASILDDLVPPTCEPDVVAFTLPLPPSVNNAYVNVPGRGRVPSKNLTQFKRDAANVLAVQRVVWPFEPGERLAVRIDVFLRPQDLNRRDVDNCAKAAIDAVASKFKFNDTIVFSVTAEKHAAVGEAPRCLMTWRRYE